MKLCCLCLVCLLSESLLWGQSAPSAVGLKGIQLNVPLTPEQFTQENYNPSHSAGLFVGINTFQDESLSSLNYAVDDAVDLAHTFAIKLSLLAPSNVWLALEGVPAKNSTKEELKALVAAGAKIEVPHFTQILRILDRLPRATGPGGMLICQFSSHGFDDEAYGGFIMMADSSVEDRKVNALNLQMIGEKMRGTQLNPTRAPRRLLLVDACRNKALIAPNGSRSNTSPNAAGPNWQKAIARAKGQATICSADVGRYSYEDSNLQQGIFTHFLLAGLNGGAASDEAGLVRLQGLVDWVGFQVEQATHDKAVPQIILPSIPTDAARIPLAFDQNKAEAVRRAKAEAEAAARLQQAGVEAFIRRTKQAQQLVSNAAIEEPSLVTSEMEGEVRRSLANAKQADPKTEKLIRQIERNLTDGTEEGREAFASWWREMRQAVGPPAVAIASALKPNAPGSSPAASSPQRATPPPRVMGTNHLPSLVPDPIPAKQAVTNQLTLVKAGIDWMDLGGLKYGDSMIRAEAVFGQPRSRDTITYSFLGHRYKILYYPWGDLYESGYLDCELPRGLVGEVHLYGTLRAAAPFKSLNGKTDQEVLALLGTPTHAYTAATWTYKLSNQVEVRLSLPKGIVESTTINWYRDKKY